MNTNVNVKVVDILNASGKVESTNELTANATVESGEVETEATVETSKTLTANLNVTIPTTLKASVEISQGTNALTKSDHAGLKNLDFESSGHTGFASKSELQEYANHLTKKQNTLIDGDGIDIDNENVISVNAMTNLEIEAILSS